MQSALRYLPLLVGIVLWLCAHARAADEPPKTGPATEKRFPPLKVPAGFKATLFACDPLIEYPSVISAGPRPGAIFVAVDYMTGLGTEITRRSEVRLVEDTDGDGYADKATLFAGGFNSIMGLAWHGGTLYVMHAPFLTALRDTRGAGMADERKDLLTGLGLTPEANPVRLHCANGVTAGHDGWLYLALGDHGVNVPRPEGDRLILEGGGILRCRMDGRDLHVFSTGLRNIYDVALDAELNVFVRDNENDGGTYKIRVCHSFFGADHGYPYLYYEQPAEALAPLADLGLGSSAGAVCYLERQFPAEYRGNLFFCEWGRSLVRYPLDRAKSSFATRAEIEFAAGGQGDPYGFKPTDVVVQRDGTLMISDYADGQRPMRGRGRIYHVAYTDATKPPSPAADLLARLDSESYFERWEAQAAIESEGEKGMRRISEALAANRIGARGRLHAIWILARAREKAIEPLLAIAKSDEEPVVRAQAVRAIADLVDPVLAKHRLDAGPGDAERAARLAVLARGQDRRVLLETIIALGRLRWAGTPDWLAKNLAEPDTALAHAAMQALRRSENWPAVLPWLDLPTDDPLRGIALRAMARQYDAGLVDGLLERLAKEKDAGRSLEIADCLARVHRRPGPWVYWDYRPKPRPPNPLAWERTEKIAAALEGMLTDGDSSTRVAVLKLMQREKIPAGAAALGLWLQEERDAEPVAALLAYFRDLPSADVRPHLVPLIHSPEQSETNRLAALSLFVQGLDQDNAASLLALAERLPDDAVLAAALRLVGKHPQPAAPRLLVAKLASPRPDVRAAAIEALGELKAAEGREHVARLLADRDPSVRRAAASAAGRLEDRPSIEPLLKLAADPDAAIRAASLDALRLLQEPRAVPLAVAGLNDPATEQIALATLRALGGPAQAGPVAALAQRRHSLDTLTSAVQTLTDWRERAATSAEEREALDRAVAEIQGASGNLILWQVSGRMHFAVGIEGKLVAAKEGSFEAQTEIAVPEATDIELLGSCGGRWRISLNGKSIHEREKPQPFRIDSDHVSATLAPGLNRLVVRVEGGSADAPIEFHLRFRRKSIQAAHEKLLAAILARPGNPERGRAVLANSAKSLCLRCHRLGEQGEKTGPELTGLGSRFSRIYIAESILQPSRTIAPSFGTLIVVLKNGRIFSGVKIAESDVLLSLIDSEGNLQPVGKAEIEERGDARWSTMPEGLEKRLTEEEFVDLVAFLASLKEAAPR